jgi:hypothetical protein
VTFARALAVKSVYFLPFCTLLDLMWSFKNAFLDTDCLDFGWWISDFGMSKFLNSKFKAILDGGFWMAQGEVFE